MMCGAGCASLMHCMSTVIYGHRMNGCSLDRIVPAARIQKLERTQEFTASYPLDPSVQDAISCLPHIKQKLPQEDYLPSQPSVRCVKRDNLGWYVGRIRSRKDDIQK